LVFHPKVAFIGLHMPSETYCNTSLRKQITTQIR